MRATGIVRQIDELGRIVLPKELREVYNFGARDGIEILTTEEGLLLKKYNPGCEFCGKFESIKYFKGKKLCIRCRKEISEDV